MFSIRHVIIFVIIMSIVLVGVFSFRRGPAATSVISITATRGQTLINNDATTSPSISNVAVPLTLAPVLEREVSATKTVATPRTLSGRVAPELVRPTGYSNIDTLGIVSTEQFTLKRYIGKKVILLEFWTSSSMNSLRTVPYLNQWYSKYNDDGLLIVAVHTPQFAFEKSKSVVDSVAFAHQMYFPIIIDNQYLTWNAYANTLWPHLYLIDMNGRIVYDRAGDGAYEATEARIIELLTSRAKKLNVPFSYTGFATPKDAYVSDISKRESGEVFFGSARNSLLTNGVTYKDGVQNFAPDAVPKLNTIVLSGSWNFTKEYAQSMTENTALRYRYSAKDVYATLGAETLTRVRVLLDGVPLTTETAGKDVRFEKDESVVYVKESRIYEIIKNSTYGVHTIEILPPSGGLKVFVLMFG